MNNKKGFSFISFLLYLMLFSIVVTFIAHIITSLLLPSLSATLRCKSIIGLHIASDLFVRDIKTLTNPLQWKRITSNELIWRGHTHDIGWSYTKNRLERREGIYNNSWKSKKIGILANNLQEGIFMAEYQDNRLISIEMSLRSSLAPDKQITCYVAVNG